MIRSEILYSTDYDSYHQVDIVISNINQKLITRQIIHQTYLFYIFIIV